MTSELPAIGWVGAGRMGSAIVERLLKAGVDVTVWNRTRAKAESLAAFGARVADELAQLRGLPVVVTMLANPTAFEEVVLGPGGLVADEGPRVLVDSSTISAEASEAVRERLAPAGTALLSAPVSGNPLTVPAGLLTVVASGPADAFDRVRPLLELFGAGVTYVGPGEEARLVKLCHNLFLGAVIEALAETTILAQRGGISRADYLRFMNNSVLGSVFTAYKTPALVNLDYEPTFTSRLLRKDVELGLAAARSMDVPLPVMATVNDLVLALTASGYADVDFAALIELQAGRSGVALEAEGVAVSDGLGTEHEQEQGS